MNATPVIVAAVILGVAANNARAADVPEPLELKEHSSGLTVVAWAADGKTLATAGNDRDLRVWDPGTGRLLRTLRHLAGEADKPIFAFTPDIKVVAVEYEGTITIRTVADGKVRTRIDTIAELKLKSGPKIVAMAFSPDGKRIAIAGYGVPLRRSYGMVVVWDAETGKIVHKFGGLSTQARAVAWSRDGKRFAAGTLGRGRSAAEAGEVWVWDAVTGKAVHNVTVKRMVKPGERFSVADVAFAPDGKRIAVLVTTGRLTPINVTRENEAAMYVWDLRTGKFRSVTRFPASVERVVFSPDGKRLATAGGDKRDRLVRVWDVETGRQLVKLSGPDKMLSVAFSPDGKSLAAGCKDGSVRIWAVPAAK